MILTDQFISSHIVNAITSTILHSLWQAPLIALLTFFALRKYKDKNASYRYNIAFFSMILILSGSLFTFLFYYLKANSFLITQDMANIASISFLNNNDITFAGTLNDDFTWLHWIEQNSFRIAISWFIGALLFSTRIFTGLWNMNRIKSSLDFNISPEINQAFRKVQKSIRVPTQLKIALSHAITTPMVMGHFKPIIVIPIAAVNHLSIEETEAILAHEIGHIIRNDYAQNILMIIIESVFFYNPAIWWICNVIKNERENSCDELVVKIYPNRMTYAKTLLKLQEISNDQKPSLAMNLLKNQKYLLERVKRILNQPITYYYARERSMAIVLLMIGITTFSSAHHMIYSDYWIDKITELNIDYLNTNRGTFNQVVSVDPISKIITLPIAEKRSIALHDDTRVNFHSISPLRLNIKPIRIDTIGDEEWKIRLLEMEKKHRTHLKELEQKHNALREQYDRELKKIKKQYETNEIERTSNNEMNLSDEMERIERSMAEINWEEFGENIGRNIEEAFDEEWIAEIEERAERLSEELEESISNEWTEKITELSLEMGDLGLEVSEKVLEAMDEDWLHEIEHLAEKIGDEVSHNMDNTRIRINLDNESSDLKNALRSQLKNDGFWNSGGNNSIVITNDYMKVNGGKVDINTLRKYQLLVKNNVSNAFESKTKISFKQKGDDSSNLNVKINR